MKESKKIISSSDDLNNAIDKIKEENIIKEGDLNRIWEEGKEKKLNCNYEVKHAKYLKEIEEYLNELSTEDRKIAETNISFQKKNDQVSIEKEIKSQGLLIYFPSVKNPPWKLL